MSGSNLVAVKKELIRRLGQEPALLGVQVTYAPTRDVKREVICGGKAKTSHALTAMRGNAPQLPRDEQAALTLYIQVRNPQSDAAAADERVMELLQVVEELLAADPTLAGFPNLLLAGVTGAELEEPAFDDDGVIGGMTAEISYRSYLT